MPRGRAQPLMIFAEPLPVEHAPSYRHPSCSSCSSIRPAYLSEAMAGTLTRLLLYQDGGVSCPLHYSLSRFPVPISARSRFRRYRCLGEISDKPSCKGWMSERFTWRLRKGVIRRVVIWVLSILDGGTFLPGNRGSRARHMPLGDFLSRS